MFPLLFWAARTLGPTIFLLSACAVGFLVRHLMLNVYPQHGLWVLGGCAVCRLPELALGMALAAWYAAAPSRVESLLLRGPALIAGLILYPFALKLYANGITYVFCDFGTGACCFLVIAGAAGLLSHVSGLAKLLSLVGIYSYGLYLIHQPYVIWLGLRIRPEPIASFLAIFVVVAAVLSAWGMILEKTTNAIVNKIIAFRKPVPVPAL
jgi:peptidoglycan/LPS O-acetylase OafA/YrhL